MRKPWQFSNDMNYDGAFTISDTYAWISQLYFMPGDSSLYFCITYLPSIAAFFEMNLKYYHSWSSAVVSFILWFAFIGLSLSLSDYLIEQKNAFKARDKNKEKNEWNG